MKNEYKQRYATEDYVNEEVGKLNEAIAGLPKSDDEEIEMLIAADLLPATTDASGAILTDENGNVILRY